LLRDLVSPESQPGYDELWRQGLAGAASGEVQLRLPGHDVPVFLTFNPLPVDSGAAVGVLVTDLGLQRLYERLTRAHAALGESEERYRTLFSSIDEGFCVVEVLFGDDGRACDYRFLEMNPAFEKQTGLRDAAGKRIRELAPDHEAHWFEVYGQVAQSGAPIRFVNEARSLGRWFDVYAFRLGASDSRKVAILFKDITAQRRVAAELEQARDQAMSALRAKDEFLATLSHELRTPLNPVLLLASEGAFNTELPVDVREDFQTITKSISLEARLIDDLLDATRIAAGKLKVELEPCDLQAVLRDAIDVIRGDLAEKQLRLTVRFASEPARVNGDAMRLQQVFWNVLRNAVHFTPDDGSILVETRVFTLERHVEVAIADSGMGIAAEDLTRIFDTFTQGDAAPGAPRRTGGLGLGLAISRTLVELHGGSIRATSPGRGCGSTFTVRLPLLGRFPGD
jgi:PAS domain S-box-containing protein